VSGGGNWFISSSEATYHGEPTPTTEASRPQLVLDYSNEIVYLPGDANKDGTVNGGDLGIVLENYDKPGMSWSQGDFNGDGTVNGSDLGAVLQNYDQHLGVGAAVPEPSTLLLAAAGLAGLLAYAWRKRK